MENATEGPSDDPGSDQLRRAVSETLDEPAHRSTTSWGPDRSPTPERIGRYLVVEVLDEGGQGVVLRVIRPELGKDYVLKLARFDAEFDQARREQMLREGRLLAQCEHPNLIRVTDLDFYEGRPYVVMDYVAGRTLQQHVEGNRPPLREAVRLVAELAKAVEYIHARGIVHQDIKPRNVVIDPLGRPKLIDFGLARLRHAWSDDTAGLIGGTPAYMSPEQARLQHEQIGPWTDVFGLGGLLYFLLTGQPVYQDMPGSSAMEQASKAEVVSPRRINPRVPGPLAGICMKAMAPDHRQRYRSAAELEHSLRLFLWRPWVAAAGLVALGLTCLVPIFWRAGASSSAVPPTAPAAEAHRVATQADAVSPAPRIVALEIKHYRGVDSPEDLGSIGSSSQEAQFDDSVRLVARLDRLAYCYLLALNPDGKIQLCAPAEPAMAPIPTADLNFPADAGSAFALTDGAGMQAFVLIASRWPLPPFQEWPQAFRLRWASVQAEGVWQFDGHQISRLARAERGHIKKLFDSPRPFAQLCGVLQNLDRIDAVSAVAFPVKPKTN
jgi:serine/threonine protein kinase